MFSLRGTIGGVVKNKVAVGYFNFYTPVLFLIITSLLLVSVPSTALAQYFGYTYKPFSYTCASCPDADKDGVASACKAVPDPNSFSACLPGPGQTGGDGVVNADCNDNDPYSYVFGSGNIASVKLTQFDASGKVLSDPISPLLSANRLSINVTFRVGCGLTTPYPSYLTNLKVFYGTKNAAGQELLIELPPTVQQPTGTFWQTVVNGPTYGASYDKPLLNLIGAPTSYVSQVVEAAIESVSAKRPVFLKFVGTTIGSRADTPFYYNIPDMTNCARMSGNGRHKVVYMRASGADLGLSNFMALSNQAITYGFNSIEPFKTYQTQFSHFFDLKSHLVTAYDGANYPSKDGSFVRKASSCGPFSSLYFLFDKVPLYGPFVSRMNNNVVFMDTEYLDDESHAIETGPIAMHEAGHAFAGLIDEYPRSVQPIFRTYLYNRATSGSNCSPRPSINYSYLSRIYGTVNAKPCMFDPLFKPSLNSLMMGGSRKGENRFNVISCGHIIKFIKKDGFAKSYFPECAAMAAKDGSIIPVGQ